jgi:hypothetical protein
LKRIWSEFDKTCSVSWQRRTSWHGQTPFWQTTKFQSEKKMFQSALLWAQYFGSSICFLQIADCKLQRCQKSQLQLWLHTPAGHQLITSLPADFEVDHLLSALSLISLMSLTVSHVSVFSSQAMWHAAVPKKIHIDLWIARPAWVPRGRHPCNGCFLTYNCCCAHLKTADSLMQ